MQYRHFPRIEDEEISVLGMGCMRLPTLAGSPAAIDEAATEKMFLAAIEAGVNYFDTAYVYHGGRSETVLGDFLAKHNLRDRVKVATKCPVWMVKEESDWDRLLNEQLARLKTDYIDFYLFHALSAERWKTILRLNGLRAFEKAMADGRIRHIGFSFHDSLESFKTIVDGYNGWEMCQIQYNYMDTEYQAGNAGIEYAAAREIGIVVMEPLRGGSLVNAPRAVREVFAEYPKPRLPVEWALRFVMERQETVTVLSGMGSESQLWENAGIAESARANSMTKKEMDLIDRARVIYRDKQKVPCTTCGYCMPCPFGVQIPDVFAMYNAASMFGSRSPWYKTGYVDKNTGGNACTQCGACLPKCPQGIAIPDRLAEAHGSLVSV
ncbi:MAG: aldo/keto reductase [Rectinemataceae bacterium]|nr:aldo/keto reductase [Rectinemataceae bacterium]